MCHAVLYVWHIIVSLRSPNAPFIQNKTLGAAYVATLFVTWYATLFIAYRIYSASHYTVEALNENRSQNWYKRIQEILVQSAVLYSVVLLVNVVLPFVPQTASDDWKIYIVDQFAQTFMIPIAVCSQ